MVTHVIQQLRVSDVMTADPVTVLGSLSVARVVDQISRRHFCSYPVLGDNQELLGLVIEARLRRSVAEGADERPVREFVDRRPSLFPAQPLVDAVVAMVQWEARQVVVIDREVHGQVVGIIAMSDIVRAQAGAALRSGHTGVPGLPQFSEVGDTLNV